MSPTATTTLRVPNAAPWGASMTYSRAMRVGDVVEVSGTTAVTPTGDVACVGDIVGQTRTVLDIVVGALAAAGASPRDVVRTRLFVTDVSRWREVGAVHDEYFAATAPVSSLVQVAGLLHPDLLIEIEATAVVTGRGDLEDGPATRPHSTSPPTPTPRCRPHHTGLTVHSLERSLLFYRDVIGLRLVYQQDKRGGYLADIVGLPDADIRMAQLEAAPGGHRIELFQYLGVASQRAPGDPWDHGISHVCLETDDIDEVVGRARQHGLEVPDPVLVDTGANRGGRGLYLRDPDGIVVELWQGPAAVTA